MKNFTKAYIETFQSLIQWDESLFGQLMQLKQHIGEAVQSGHKIIVAGNGGSAATAAHVAVDLSKNAATRSICFNEADLITCLANDFGYEQWLKQALSMYADAQDVVVLISSSGKSPNMVNAAQWCKDHNVKLITLTGMDKANPMIELNIEGINLWVDSKSYNHIEMTHQFWLLMLVDMIIGKSEYSA